MAVTVIDPAEGAFSKAIAGLGKAVSERIYATNIKEKEILDDIDLMKGAAAGYRAAISAGQGDTYLNALGVGPEFGEQYLVAFPETYLEQLETGRVQRGVGTAAAQVEEATARLTLEEAQQIMDLGAIPMQVRARYATDQKTTAEWAALKEAGTLQAEAIGRTQAARSSIPMNRLAAEQANIQLGQLDLYRQSIVADYGVRIYEGKRTEAFLAANFPELEAEWLATEAAFKKDSYDAFRALGGIRLQALGDTSEQSARRAENLYTAAYYTVLNANGVPKIRADLEKTSALLEQAEVTFNKEQLKYYIDAMNDVDQTTPEGRQFVQIANAYIVNPGFGQFLGAGIARDAAARAAQPTPQELILESAQIQEEMDTRLKTLIEAISDDASDEDIAALGQSYNNMVNGVRELVRKGLILPLDLTYYDIEQEALVPEKFTSTFSMAAARDFARALDQSAAAIPMAERNAYRVATIEQALVNIDELAAAGDWNRTEKDDMEEFLHTALDISREAPAPQGIVPEPISPWALDPARRLNFRTEAEYERFLEAQQDIATRSTMAYDLFWIQEMLGQSGLPITRNIQSPLGPNPPG